MQCRIKVIKKKISETHTQNNNNKKKHWWRTKWNDWVSRLVWIAFDFFCLTVVKGKLKRRFNCVFFVVRHRADSDSERNINYSLVELIFKWCHMRNRTNNNLTVFFLSLNTYLLIGNKIYYNNQYFSNKKNGEVKKKSEWIFFSRFVEKKWKGLLIERQRARVTTEKQ